MGSGSEPLNRVKRMAQNQDMLDKIRNSNGFIAALDQSGGSTPKALKNYGYKGDEWSSDEEMFDLVHKMRVRIITAPPFIQSQALLQKWDRRKSSRRNV